MGFFWAPVQTELLAFLVVLQYHCHAKVTIILYEAFLNISCWPFV